MEVHQLRYFVAVAETGSFTRAAERCLVAQPSLSQQIRKLEEELGQALFERLGRRVRLTAAGHILYERAASILASLAEAQDALRDPARLREGGYSENKTEEIHGALLMIRGSNCFTG